MPEQPEINRSVELTESPGRVYTSRPEDYPETEVPQAAVSAAVAQLEEAITSAGMHAAHLAERLQPVLHAQGPEKDSVGPGRPPYEVPLADHLEGLRRRVDDLCFTLGELHRRVEL